MDIHNDLLNTKYTNKNKSYSIKNSKNEKK